MDVLKERNGYLIEEGQKEDARPRKGRKRRYRREREVKR